MNYNEKFTHFCIIDDSDGSSHELFKCDDCGAIVSYWSRETHYNWHKALATLLDSFVIFQRQQEEKNNES